MQIHISQDQLNEVWKHIPIESLAEGEFLYLNRVVEILRVGRYVNSRSYLHETSRIKTMTDDKLRSRLERISSRNKLETFICALVAEGKYEVLKHALKHRVYRTDLK